MLLKAYHLEIFNSACNPGAMTVHCFAHLDQDVSEAIPYLNAVLGGYEYIKDPPAVTFKVQGKLITVHGRKIAINALKDDHEARKIVEWLKREINQAWEKRDEIEPTFEGSPKPGPLDILKLLPKTNCRDCAQATCMVFAVLVSQGVKGADQCPMLDADAKKKIESYMARFKFVD